MRAFRFDELDGPTTRATNLALVVIGLAALRAVLLLAQAPLTDMDRAKAIASATYSDHVCKIVKSGNTSDPGIWESEPWKDGDFLEIPEGIEVQQDTDSPKLWIISCKGKIVARPPPLGTLRLSYDTLVLWSTGGLYCGESREARARGDWKHTWLNRGPINTAWDVTAMSRGLINMGGEIRIYGRYVTPRQWTTGNRAGDTKITFKDGATVEGWRVDDTIGLPRQDWLGNDDDVVTIKSIADDRKSIVVNQPLKMAHGNVDASGGWRPMFAVNLTRRGINFESESLDPLERGHMMHMMPEQPGKMRALVDMVGYSVFNGGRSRKDIDITDPDGKGGGLANPRGRYPDHDHNCGLDMMSFREEVLIYGSLGPGLVNHSSYMMAMNTITAYCFGVGHWGEVGNELGSFCNWTAFRSTHAWAAKPKYDNSVGQGPDQDLKAANADWGRNGDGVHVQGGGIKVCHGIATGQTHAAITVLGIPFRANTVFQTKYLPAPWTSKLTSIKCRFIPFDITGNYGFGNYMGIDLWRMNQGDLNHPEFVGRGRVSDNRMESILGSFLHYMSYCDQSGNANIAIAANAGGSVGLKSSGWGIESTETGTNFENEVVHGFLNGIIAPQDGGTEQNMLLIKNCKFATQFGVVIVPQQGPSPLWLNVKDCAMVQIPGVPKQTLVQVQQPPLTKWQHVHVNDKPLEMAL